MIHKIKNILGSNHVRAVFIIFFALQAVMLALSFKYPMIFDERYHFEVIKIYSNQQSPIIAPDQLEKYDVYGSLSFGSASLYHYLLSFPLRVFDSLGASTYAEIVSLRMINIFFVMIGLLMYARVFMLIGVKNYIINLTLLYYSLIPLTTLVAATISYDNLQFLILAILLNLGVRIIKYNRDNINSFAVFLLMGMLGMLIKFTFAPVFLLMFGVLLFFRTRAMGYRVFAHRIVSSIKHTRPLQIVLITTVLSILLGLASYRYLYPVAKYGSPNPDCAKVLSENRCLKSGVFAAEREAGKTRYSRQPISPDDYILNWYETIILQLDTSGAVISEKRVEFGTSLPVIATMIGFFVTSGLLLIFYQWKTVKPKSDGYIFVCIVALITVGLVLVFNMGTYYSVNMDLNVQARYLIPVIPIFIMLVLVSFSYLRLHKTIKTTILLSTLILCTQGGGVIKHLVTSEKTWINDDVVTQTIYEKTKDLTVPLVVEN